MRKKRIVIVAYPLVPTKIGGVETYFRGVIPAILNNLSSHFEAKLIIGKAALPYLRFWCDNGGNKTDCIVSKKFPEISSFLSRVYALGIARYFPQPLEKEINQLKPDLVFFPLTVCVPLLNRKGRKFPIVTTIHDVLHIVRPDLFKSVAEKAYRGISYRPTCSNSDGIIVPSAYTQVTLNRFFKVPFGKTKVIPYGLNYDLFSRESSGDDDKIIVRHNLEDKRFVIYPANTWFHKNHAGLIKAWKSSFSNLSEDLWLVFCGRIFKPIPDQEKLQKYRILHIGYVKQEDLSTLFRRAHAMIFPSLFEGFGAPPLEAMACGTVTISSKAASLSEVLPEGYRLSFNPENIEEMSSIIQVGCNNDVVRAKAVSMGYEHSRKFSWDLAGKRHVEFFSSLLT